MTTATFDLVGARPTSIRWNSEEGTLAYSSFNEDEGAFSLQSIELGADATFALDLATISRGYGLVRVGVFDMRLTPVGTAPPAFPGDDYKRAIGVNMWNPQLGDCRIETNGTIFRDAIERVYEQAIAMPEAVAGALVIQFIDKRAVTFKSLGKSFLGPVIKIVGWVKRDEVPGWASRPPTVVLPKNQLTLPSGSEARPALESNRSNKSNKTSSKSSKPSSQIRDELNDDLPESLK
jgi:hypothetical protein